MAAGDEASPLQKTGGDKGVAARVFAALELLD
jgi:hypothetical protein